MAENEDKKFNNGEDVKKNVTTEEEMVITDFVDFVKTSRKPIAIKLKELLNKYLDEKELQAIYDNSSDKSLENILKDTARYISENNNGIKLDKWGNYLSKESRASAMELGMADSRDYVDFGAIDKFTEEIIKSGIVGETIKIESLGEIDITSFLGKLYSESGENIDLGKDIDEFLYRDIKDMKLSDNLKDVVLEDRNTIKNSKYENDMHLYEISKLEYEIEKAKGTNSPILEQLLRQRKEFYENHKKYIGNVPIRKADGRLDYDEVFEMRKFGNAYQRTFILRHFDAFEDMSKETFLTYDSEEKEHFLISALIGIGYENDSKLQYREMALEAKKILKQINPDLNVYNDKCLEDFFKKQLNIKGSNLNLNELIETISRKFEYAIDNYITKDNVYYKDGKPDFSKFEFDVSSRINHDSVFENYFEDSRIKFDKNDEDLYNITYRDTTIDAWIENKDDAIKLRYMALLSVKKEYEQMPENSYAADKLNKINDDLAKYNKYFGKIEISPEEKEYFEGYKEQFINAGIMKYLTRDAFEWQNGGDYNKLEEEHKKGYIRNILAALEYSGANNTSIKKMALRRLELMNTEDKKFILFDENGGYTINNDEILKEYKSLSKFNYKNFDDLLVSVQFRRNEYLLTKLKEYTHLREEDFLQLPDKEDSILCMKEIDRVRVESNQERIEGRKITDDDIFSAIGKGKAFFEEIDISETRRERIASNGRTSNQEEADENNNTTDTSGSEKKSPIEIGNINVSTIQDKPPKFIDRAKKVFKNIKDRFKNVFKREEQLQIEAPKGEVAQNGSVVENKKVGYDINMQFEIDHNIANSGKNLGGKIHGDQDPEIGGIEG